jgi:hypothetical protein
MIRDLTGYIACGGAGILALACGVAGTVWLIRATRDAWRRLKVEWQKLKTACRNPFDIGNPHDDAYPESESEPIEPAGLTDAQTQKIWEQIQAGLAADRAAELAAVRAAESVWAGDSDDGLIRTCARCKAMPTTTMGDHCERCEHHIAVYGPEATA